MSFTRYPLAAQQWLREHPRGATGLIIALALILRAIAIVRFEELNHVMPTDRPSVAYALLHGRGYADTYGPGSGPTAHFSPLYTLLLTGIYGVVGFGKAGVLAGFALGLAMVAGVMMLLLPLASACGLSRTSAYLGGLIFAIPTSMIAENGLWDAPLTAAFIVLTIVGAAKLIREDRWTDRDAVAAGLLLGIALLVSPSPGLWFGLLGAGAFFFLRQRRFVLIAAGVTFAVLLPWMIRNQVVLGAPIWSRSNFGFEFNRSHTGQTCVEFWDCLELPQFLQSDPTYSAPERRRVAEIGEVRYDRENLKAGLRWAFAHPREEARLTAARILRFWFPSPRRTSLQAVLVWGTTILGLVGMAMWFRASNGIAWAVLGLVVTFPLVYYLIYSVNRYRYPLTPVLALFAGELMHRVALRLTAKPTGLARAAHG